MALGCLTALLWRRRFPLAVAMTVAIASTASALATGAAFLALVSISTRRRPVEIGAVGLAFVTASQFAVGFYPVESPPGSLWLQLAFPALTAGIAVAVGMAIGARRVEVRSLRDRAESAEREQTARAAQARALERNRIAREMHDVLAHRISLVAMQAGVLDHRRATSRPRRTACWSAASPTAPTRPWKNYGTSSACSAPTRAARNHPNPPSTESPNWWPTPAPPDWTSRSPPP